MKKIYRIILYILILFSFPLIGKEVYQLEIPNHININLNNNNYSKYMKNAFRAYTDGDNETLNNIKEKYKKWINASIIENKKIDIKIAIKGDLKDHLNIPTTSLKLKLLNDEYFYGVKKFNLFLPDTRKGSAEIYWSLLLKYVGFPTYHTKFVNVKLNNTEYQALFQEDSTKEFLERNYLRETPILRNNDYFWEKSLKDEDLYDKYFSTAFLIDNKSFLKNRVSIKIASDAIALKNSLNFTNRIEKFDFFKQINLDWAPHALHEDNLRYIYIPYSKTFIPLYYNGNPNLLFTKINCDKIKQTKDLELFEKEYYNLSSKLLTKKEKCVFNNLFPQNNENLKDRYKIINKIKNPINFGVKYEFIKNRIINYLEKYKIDSDIKNKGIKYTFLINDKYYICNFDINIEDINQCKNLTENEYISYLTKDKGYKTFKDFKFFNINLGTLDINNTFINIEKLNANHNQYILDEPLLYWLNSKTNQNYNFIFNNLNAKLIINGKNKKNNFVFENINSENSKLNLISRYDQNLLTGCVTFIDSTFDEVNIKIKNMNCEDSINVIRSKGTINKLEISKSKFDGLDMDFSKLIINNLIINNSGNDCADFSYGNYNILKSSIKNCGDKGFSVGEKSYAKIINSNISNSLVGLASKDDSFVEINDSKIDNIINYCLSAYNKKPEFGGSSIKKKNLVCDNRNYIDNISKIYE